MKIRIAEKKDQKEILAIYNEAVLNTTATFDIEERTEIEQIDYFNLHKGRHNFIVYEDEKKIMGWAAISKWSSRDAYKDTGEISIYVKKEYRGKGIGKKLFLNIIKRGKENTFHTLISLICSENELSIEMHKKEKFQIIGEMKEVGKKFDRFLDVIIMQKIL